MEEMKVTLKEIVAQRLSAAPESTAKGELIEELAENLYCRYTDLVNAGVESEDAKARAVDALGDTDELVEYLKGLEPDQPLPELVLDEEKPDGGQIEEILRNVEGILRGAFHKAKGTFKEARDTFREAREAAKEQEKAARLNELKQEMSELETAIEEKRQKIDETRASLEQLEAARDALEEVEDQSAVECMLAELEVKIGARESAIDCMEEELDGMEAALDVMETELDELEDESDALEDAEFEELEDLEELEDPEEGEASEKSWKVTYKSKDGKTTVEIDGDTIKSSVKDAMKDIEKVIRDATGVAKDAAKDAARLAKETAEKVRDDVSAACSPGDAVEADQPVNADQLKRIDVQTIGGDVTVRMTQAPDGDVLVGGDIEGIEVFRSESGVLTIRPVKTETSSFFFGRGIFSNSSADVVLDLPCRGWDSLKLSTTGGDVKVTGSCPVEGVAVTTVNGDINVSLPACTDMTCRTTNGDVEWTGDADGVSMESISGDLRYHGVAHGVTLKSTSGDVTAEGEFLTATARTISGDVCLRSSRLPGRIDAGTTSGDIWVDIPDEGPFTARFRSTSGDFTSDFFTGRMGGRNCVFNYQGGGENQYAFTSVSGDVEIRKYR